MPVIPRTSPGTFTQHGRALTMASRVVGCARAVQAAWSGLRQHGTGASAAFPSRALGQVRSLQTSADDRDIGSNGLAHA